MGLFKRKENVEIEKKEIEKVGVPEGDVIIIKDDFHFDNMYPYYSNSAYETEYVREDRFNSYTKVNLLSKDILTKRQFPLICRVDVVDKDSAIKAANDTFDRLNNEPRYGFYHGWRTSNLDTELFISCVKVLSTKYVLNCDKKVEDLEDSKFITVENLRDLYRKLISKATTLYDNTNNARPNELRLFNYNCGLNLVLFEDHLPELYYSDLETKCDLSLEDLNILINSANTSYGSLCKIKELNSELNKALKEDYALREEINKDFNVKIEY